jgi:ribose-phosphate pyrophosphokinase
MKTKIFSIDGRTEFAQLVVEEFNNKLEHTAKQSDCIISLGKVKISDFSDNEMSVSYEEYIRGHKVFLICSTNSSNNIMKLMLAADAARRASAQEIIAILPYYGYARQDRKDGLRGAVGAKVIANMLVANGVDRIITIELHADQIQGFFNMPVDHISGLDIFYGQLEADIRDKIIPNPTICSPDAGGVKRADKYFKKLVNKGHDNITFAMFSKMREKPNEVARLDLIGDVKGRDVIIIDDMVDTAGTLCGTAEEIMKAGASSVRAIITHGVLSGPAIDRIIQSKLTEIILSDTLKLNDNLKQSYTKKEQRKFKFVSCTRQIATLIEAISETRSADMLLSHDNY